MWRGKKLVAACLELELPSAARGASHLSQADGAAVA